MWVVGTLMSLNVNWYDVEEGTCLCKRTWVRVLCMTFMCCLSYYYFDNIFEPVK